VFWRPDLYAQVVILAPCGDAFPTAKTFQPSRWPGHLEARDGRGGRHVLLRVGRDTHQVWVDPSLRDGGAMTVVTPAVGAAEIRLDAANRLLRALAGRGPRAHAQRRGRKLERYRLALGAFDDWRAGRAYRDIAVRLYGRGGVEAEAWRTSPLRDAAIRLTRLGRSLVSGGYRGLLSRGPG
jgi:hypothetical protein